MSPYQLAHAVGMTATTLKTLRRLGPRPIEALELYLEILRREPNTHLQDAAMRAGVEGPGPSFYEAIAAKFGIKWRARKLVVLSSPPPRRARKKVSR